MHLLVSANSASKLSAALPPTYTIVSTDLLEQILEAIKQFSSSGPEGPMPLLPEDNGYVEPGPQSPRKWFTVKELTERWGWKKTKIYDLSPHELPYWSHRGSGRLYFWAYVWSFENRIARDVGDGFKFPLSIG